MAFTYVVNSTTKAGDVWIVSGTWDGTGVTGGDIKTGLKTTLTCVLGHTGAAVEAAVAVCNETFPLASGDVTIVCTSGDAGTFIAVGR